MSWKKLLLIVLVVMAIVLPLGMLLVPFLYRQLKKHRTGSSAA
jgi:hypothetical protein